MVGIFVVKSAFPPIRLIQQRGTLPSQSMQTLSNTLCTNDEDSATTNAPGCAKRALIFRKDPTSLELVIDHRALVAHRSTSSVHNTEQNCEQRVSVSSAGIVRSCPTPNHCGVRGPSLGDVAGRSESPDVDISTLFGTALLVNLSISLVPPING